MKIKFQFGDFKSSITCNNNFVKYFEDMNRSYMELLGLKKPGSRSGGYTLPATGHDIYNYVARYGLANHQIQAILKLNGRLDFNKLSRAVRLAVDAQPVFGCRFVESEPPYWKRHDNLDKIQFCSLEETDDPGASVRRFLESPLDMDRDPMVKVRLVRSGEYDTLCIKINHACCDGVGTKEYISLLTEIYSSIDGENGIFIPNPYERTRKDQDRLFKELGIPSPEDEWISGSEITRATWPFPWKQAMTNATCIVTRSLSKDQMEFLKLFTKALGATVNDVLLTAFYRVMAETGQPNYDEPMEIPFTIDLRRYLPDRKTESIRNFSGSDFSRLALVPGETFKETLQRVKTMMDEIKKGRPGLQSAIGLERVERLSLAETLSYYRTISQWSSVCGDKCAPVLSNVGIISEDLLKFDNTIVTEAYIVPPVVKAPSFLLMTSTYNDVLTLAAGFYEGSVRKEIVEKLLDRMKEEIGFGCMDWNWKTL